MSRILTALDLIRDNFARGARVLCYHTVIERWVDKRVQWPVAVSLSAFEQHIKHLANNYEIVPLDMILGACKRSCRLYRMVAITFDDGYMSNYRIVYPYLKSLNIPFTVFVCTGYLSTARRLPAFVARCAVYRNPRSEMQISSLGRVYSLASDEARDRAAASLAQAIRGLSAQGLATLSDDLIAALGPDIWQECIDLFESDELMQWKHVVEMAQGGVSIGVHTHNHVIMRNCRSNLEFYEEVVRPKNELLAHGIDANLFAYPSGKRCDIGFRAVRAVAAAGYCNAFTTSIGRINAVARPYYLPRLPGQIESIDAFSRILNRTLFDACFDQIR